VTEPTGPLADPGLVIGDDDCVTATVPCQVKPYRDIAVGLESVLQTQLAWKPRTTEICSVLGVSDRILR
jgi:hypothetical protein